MANKMLIDATHPEETRVVVTRGNRVEEFDFESAHRKQLRGNIYLAKVTRVEPSLQAAFVDYGGNRHGFLAFSEIHPDYYQIPVADRQALIDEEQQAARAAEDEIDRRSHRHRRQERHHDRHDRQSASRRHDETIHGEVTAHEQVEGEQAPAFEEPLDHIEETAADAAGLPDFSAAAGEASFDPEAQAPAAFPVEAASEGDPGEPYPASAEATMEAMPETEAAHETPETEAPEAAPFDPEADAPVEAGDAESTEPSVAREHTDHDDGHEDSENGDGEEIVESVGGADALEEVPDRAPRYRRQYKIQEVIKRRQVMLVQVVKEERGTKGAALTTYLSLAGRYSVLMPNTARGGGISRKITNTEDRGRLKEIAQELEVPEGMGVILRTAGASRTKTEIKRDFEYLLRLWETVRDLTLKSTAPKLVYEEGSLVKRSIRDLYSKDIDEVAVAGPEAYQEAKDFMRMLMPSHAKNVRLYAETQPLLSRYGVESQLDAMFSPVVQLRSGGYIVINQAEALVAIDVNSGRATREHHIEDTALKTNLEAADEIARQLRLRDLAGLIVIDFIDMDEKRNNRSVERRLKECLKQDRARIQVGRISHFGLLEMSRQRIRASVLESSTEKCPYCGGSGHVRSVSSLALQVLRALEEQLMRNATHNLIARTRPDVALYVLNQKRAHLRALEERFAITLTISSDESVRGPQAFIIERGEQVHTPEAARALAEQAPPLAAPLEEEDDLEEAALSEGEDAEEAGAETAATEREGGPRRRRRRRGRGRGRENGDGAESHAQQPSHETMGELEGEEFVEAEGEVSANGDASAGEPQDEAPFGEREDRGEPQGERRRRRRGRRGGRRNRNEREQNGHAGSEGLDGDSQSPQHEFASDQGASDQGEWPAQTETQPAHDTAGFDGGPMQSEPAEPSVAAPASMHVEVTPTAEPVLPAEPEPAEPPAPRHRSTVREPAVSGADAASSSAPAESAPEPVITETDEGETASRPRRTGWWSRRSAGE